MKYLFFIFTLFLGNLIGDPITEFSLLLKPSPHGGIGVFAAQAISKGTNIFPKKHPDQIRKIEEIPAPFLKYCVFLNDEECLTPKEFDQMDVGWFINHSATPNTTYHSEEELITSRNIEAGEEILMDYNELGEPEEFKEAFYSENKN